MSRDQALKIIAEYGEQRPDQDITKLCAFIGISEAHFREIEERFRNRDIWSIENGRWVIKDFIISDWKWP